MLWTERIESLKAGALGAIATGGAALLFASLNFFLLDHFPLADINLTGINLTGINLTGINLANLNLTALDFNQVLSANADFAWPPMLLKLAIALISGFLFGVTYRYIIRQDKSDHLRSGAVLAFALIRGLAQVEHQLEHPDDLLNELVLALGLLVQGWLMFAIARWLLDLGLSRGWLSALGLEYRQQGF